MVRAVQIFAQNLKLGAKEVVSKHKAATILAAGIITALIYYALKGNFAKIHGRADAFLIDNPAVRDYTSIGIGGLALIGIVWTLRNQGKKTAEALTRDLAHARKRAAELNKEAEEIRQKEEGVEHQICLLRMKQMQASDRLEKASQQENIGNEALDDQPLIAEAEDETETDRLAGQKEIYQENEEAIARLQRKSAELHEERRKILERAAAYEKKAQTLETKRAKQHKAWTEERLAWDEILNPQPPKQPSRRASELPPAPPSPPAGPDNQGGSVARTPGRGEDRALSDHDSNDDAPVPPWTDAMIAEHNKNLPLRGLGRANMRPMPPAGPSPPQAADAPPPPEKTLTQEQEAAILAKMDAQWEANREASRAYFRTEAGRERLRPLLPASQLSAGTPPPLPPRPPIVDKASNEEDREEYDVYT